METAKRLTNKIKENKELKDQAKLDRDKIKEYEDKITAQSNHIDEQETKLKEYARKQREGYCWEIKNKEGMIIDMGTVPPYSEFTFAQPIPKEMALAKYKRFPFYMRENAQIKIHTKNYMVYNSM
jgi:hypothetical protein